MELAVNRSPRLAFVAILLIPIVLRNTAASVAAAQNPPAQAPAASAPAAPAAAVGAGPCDSPEHHQFDFWAGVWDVSGRNGQVAGTNTITPILGGCVLQEHWRGAKGMEGVSFNRYDTSDHLWHQTWVDSTGSQLVLSGRLVDGRMVLAGDAHDAHGAAVRDRITWTPGDDGTVRQVWEQSKDDGRTWTTVFDGLYAPHR